MTLKKIDLSVSEQAEKFVIEMVRNELPYGFFYHSEEHLKNIVDHTQKIGQYHNFGKEDQYILQICGLFHDIGYVRVIEGHEKVGADIAENFLTIRGIETTQINIVTNAILATKIPQNPMDIYAKILCDADLMNLTYNDYFGMAEKMRLEWKHTGIANMTEAEFHLNSIEFFQLHHYHTEYGKKILQPKKENVLQRIKDRLAELK